MRRLAYVGLTVIALACIVGEFCSDFFIRGGGLDGKHGINADAWDNYLSTIIAVWFVATVWFLVFGKKA